jgi:hypothetical protein
MCQYQRTNSEDRASLHKRNTVHRDEGNALKKQVELPSKVPSWYPSATEITQNQRDQVLKSRQDAADFAAQKFGNPANTWWRRLLGIAR